jgi:hypothetical protein
VNAPVIIEGAENRITLTTTGRPVYVTSKASGAIQIKPAGPADLNPAERHELAEVMVEAFREWGGLTL